MSNKDLNRSIKIFIDGTQAAQGVTQVETAIQKLEAKLAGLNKSEANYATKSKQLQQEINRKNKTLQDYKKKVEETNRVLKNLSGATYNELIAVQATVRNQLREAVPGTQRHTVALEQNRRVTEALTRAQMAMRVEVGCQGTAMGKAIGLFNKYAAVVTTGIAGITGATMALNTLRTKRNEREEAKADVEALTGLDQESINWLEQQAKQLSTTMDESGIRIRQSATEILDAYKLVGSAKPELLENKEALAEVTKQTLILASASGMSLKDAVDAVTLSLNQYGDGADQAARYANVMAAGSKYGAAAVESVTNAITKSGVAAASAGIPIEQLVGTIETLAEKGIKDEIAGTGLKKFFLTLQTGADDTNPKIVGLETALDNLQKKQLSATQIKKMFGEEGYNVASVLINEAEKVKYYTEAVTGTSVAMEQAATKSSTAAAKLDQAKNRMHEMGIELMDKLNPALVSAANKAVNWTGKLITLVDFITRHSQTILMLVTAISGYILISKAQIIEEKLKFFWQEKVIASLKRVYAVLLRHPYAAAAAAILILITYLREMNKELTTAEQIESDLSDIRKRATDSVRVERAEVEQLLSIARDENLSKGEREAAIRRLNEISPEYLGNLNFEKIQTDEATAAVNKYVESLILLEEIKHSQDKVNELRDKREDMMKNGSQYSDLDNASYKIAKGVNYLKSSFVELTNIGNSATDSWADSVISSVEQKGIAAIQAVDQEIEVINGHIEETRKKLIQVQSEETKPNQGGSGGKGSLTPEEIKAEIKKKMEAEKDFYEQEQAKLKEMYLKGDNDKLQTEKQFNKEMERLQIEHLQRSIQIVGEKNKEAAQYQNQINDVKLKQRKEQIQQQIDEEKALYEQQQNDLKELYASGKDENLNSEEAYNDAMEQLTMMHLERILQIADLNAEQRKAIEKQLLDFKVKCVNDELKARQQLEKKDSSARDALAKKEQQRFQQQVRQYTQYGQLLGDSLGAIISRQENAMEGFADTMIDIVFDVLTQIINAELIKLTGVGISAAAEVTAREIGSKGFIGIGTGALLAGLVTAGIAAARSTLKGLIGKKKDTGDSTDPSDTPTPPKTANVTVNQWADGRYDVIGQDDNRTYHDVPYIGPAPTGIVTRTSLVSENGAELIVNAEDLKRLQHHINYPLVVQAINDARTGRVPQYRDGDYEAISKIATEEHAVNIRKHQQYAGFVSADDIKQLAIAVNELQVAVKTGMPQNIRAYVVLRDLHQAEELNTRARKPFTKKEK